MLFRSHWQGKTVSPCDVKTPRYDDVKIYSRLGQDTSIRYELALTPDRDTSLAGEDRKFERHQDLKIWY